MLCNFIDGLSVDVSEDAIDQPEPEPEPEPQPEPEPEPEPPYVAKFDRIQRKRLYFGLWNGYGCIFRV